MLRAAVAMVHHAGLTVSLDHISFEDVIRDADVSRSIAHHAGRTEPFSSDLIEALAEGRVLQGRARGVRADPTGRQRFPGELDTPGQRHELLTELFRRLALLDFQALADSPEWQTYIALQAALTPSPSRGVRVRAALAASEQ